MYTPTIRYHIDNLITNIFKKCFIGDYMIINLMESFARVQRLQTKELLINMSRNNPWEENTIMVYNYKYKNSKKRSSTKY